ncbi:MAG: hypothetical protein KAV42_03720 [Candidatus Krumholzibacteria bacterium]|nr:hypothetical protein [Candidatus Krumholzibacteria bacterium]
MLAIISIILKHKKIVMIVTVSGMIISAVTSLMISPRYIARGAFLPAGVEKELAGGESFFSGLGSLGETYATFVRVKRNFIIEYIVRSRRMCELMSERFDLGSIYHVDESVRACKKLSERTGMIVGNEGVLTISIEDSDPVRARDMASAYLEFIDMLLVEFTMENASSKRDFLETEKVRREKMIAGLDDEIVRFMKENGVFEVQQQARATYRVIAGLTARETLIEIEKTMLEMTMKPTNPELERLELELDAVRKRVSDLVEGDGGGELFPPLDELQAISSEYLGLMSERIVHEFALAFVNLKLEDVRIAAGSDVSVIRIIDPPFVPEMRSWPKRKQIVLVGTASAFLWICFILLLRQQIKAGRFSDAEDESGADASAQDPL